MIRRLVRAFLGLQPDARFTPMAEAPHLCVLCGNARKHHRGLFERCPE